MTISDQLNEAEKIKVDEINTSKVNKIISTGLPIGLAEKNYAFQYYVIKTEFINDKTFFSPFYIISVKREGEKKELSLNPVL